MNRHTVEMLGRLQSAGISAQDALTLRRIAMTLQRWYELECGDGNSHGSWAIERDEKTNVPYFVHYHYMHGKDTVSRTKIADREQGAMKRAQKIILKYPGLSVYYQTDPRGAPLYVIRPDDIPNPMPEGLDVDSFYNRGIAVHR